MSDQLEQTADKGFVTVTTRGVFEGFALDVTFRCQLDLVGPSLRCLARRGITPPPKPRVWEHDADGNPICPKHDVAMKPRGKQGDEWHSHACLDAAGNPILDGNGKEVYCKGRPGNDSKGWYTPAEPPDHAPSPGRPR